jgi:alpha-L-fucosidase
LTELLSNYGPIDLLWFDGWGWQVGYDAVPYETIRAHVKSLQPNCLILENNHKKALQNTEIVGFEQNVDGVPAANTLPAEMAGNIRGQEADGDSVWFYHPAGNCNLKSVETLKSELVGANTGHANFLLDVTPDDQGVIPQCQVDRLKEVAAAL